MPCGICCGSSCVQSRIQLPCLPNGYYFPKAPLLPCLLVFVSGSSGPGGLTLFYSGTPCTGHISRLVTEPQSANQIASVVCMSHFINWQNGRGCQTTLRKLLSRFSRAPPPSQPVNTHIRHTLGRRRWLHVIKVEQLPQAYGSYEASRYI